MRGEKFAIGIDVGSTAVKLVLISGDRKVAHFAVEPTDPRISEQASRLIREAREKAGEEVPVVATGYGRKLVREKAREVTEISCHARGAFHFLGREGTLIDIGGQDSKVISVGEGGTVLDFVMNDKCAAGTGKFLENAAVRLRLSVEEMGDIAAGTREEVSISSTCTVFAESEIVSLIAQGTDVPSIVRGLHRALVKRVVAMARTLTVAPPVMLSGGVAKNRGIQQILSEEVGLEVLIPEDPQITGAVGAALFGLDT
ncbi:MAG: 2-hydroxyglutaryl-CoA dehydratase [Deltaproteobacteria bacterium]|nr:MAG: 2-hydroxyglutaryl-CoA dehydratase [Deltaproteobacteria bacterium]